MRRYVLLALGTRAKVDSMISIITASQTMDLRNIVPAVQFPETRLETFITGVCKADNAISGEEYADFWQEHSLVVVAKKNASS